MTILRAHHSLLFLAPILAACATTPDDPGGGASLPNAAAGPFRALTSEELGNLRIGPRAFEDDDFFGRDIAIVDLDGDPSTFDVAGFVAAAIDEGGAPPTATSPTRRIVRYDALDGRSFGRTGADVITVTDAWEGDVIEAPSALLVEGRFYLYYAAQGGIGLARSDDGVTFTKEPGPVLGVDPGGWELGRAPKSPGVVRLEDGSFRMFYEIAIDADQSVIGEAISADGVTFTRAGSAPLLTHGEPDEATGEPAFDGASVGSPMPVLVTPEVGGAILRVYYGARDATGKRTIGLAARYGSSGALSRAVGPVFGAANDLGPREPWVVVWSGFALLFATQEVSAAQDRPAVAAGVAPATATLPPPSPD